MLFCFITSTVPGRPHAGLPRELGLVGAPRVGFLDADGRLLLEVPPATHTVARFASFAAQTRQLLDLRARTAQGDARAKAALLIFRIEHRQLTRAQVIEERARLTHETAAETQRLDGLLLDMTLSDRILAAGQDRARRREVGREFLMMLRAGTRPTPDVTRGFWFVILEHAEEQKDVPAYETALAGLRAQLDRTDPDAPWARTLIDTHTAVLTRLRAAAR